MTYGHPMETGRRQVVEVTTNLFDANNWREEAWLWGGDFNDSPEEAGAAAVAASQAGEVAEGCEGGTRWNSDGKVDWFATNAKHKVSDMKETEAKISDHNIMDIWLDTKIRIERRVGKLERTPDRRKPEDVQAAYWGEVLCEAWEGMQESETWSSLEGALEKEEVKVEEEWEQYNRALMDLFARGFWRLAEEAKEKGKDGLAKNKKVTRFGKPEPKDRCIKWKIQTAINEKACKRYARGDSTHNNS